MRWAPATASARLRVAVATVVAVLLASMLPSILAASGPATTAALIGLSLALATLYACGPELLLLGARTPALAVPTDDRATALRRGRPTDPTHHPLRPRAPGQA